VPEENFWTLWCKGNLTEADTPIIRLGSTPSGLTSAHLHHPPIFLQARCPSCHPTNGVKALKATSNRIVNEWNILSEEIIAGNSLSRFKRLVGV